MNDIIDKARELRAQQRELEKQSLTLWTLKGIENNNKLCQVETELGEVKKELKSLIEQILEPK